MDASTVAYRAEGAPRDLDELAGRLRDRRADAGSPSFSELTRRVARLREERGVPARERTPGRVTVYDCFREGRRRVDVDLVLDILRALGADAAEVAIWRAWCVALQPVAAPSLVAVRHGLPPGPERFVGRRAELARLRSARGPVLIAGMAGAGKTQLAVRAVRELLESGAAREALVVDARASAPGAAPDAGTIVSSIARGLGLTGDDPGRDEARVGEVAAELVARRAALLVDDAADLAQVAPLVRAVTTPLVIVSRNSFAATGRLEVVELGAMRAEEGAELLAALLGSERVAAEEEAARDIAVLAAGLPLASSLMAARIAERPDWSLADHRDALARRLSGLHLDGAMSESLALSYRALRPEARRALRLLAVQPCDALAPAALARLLDVPVVQAETLARELMASHCAEPAGGDRVALHALVRAFALARSWDEDTRRSRDEALARLADEFAAQAWVSVEAIFPGHVNARWVERAERPVPEAEVARAWLAEELSGIVALARAIEESHPALVVELAEAVGIHLERQGLLRVARELFERAVSCAERTRDDALLASSHLLLGLVLLRLADSHARRELEDAVACATRCGRLRVVVTASNSLAIAAAHAGETAAALDRFRAAREAAREVAPDLYGMLTDNYGVMRGRAGDLEGALELHREAYEFSLARGDRHRASVASGNASDAQLRLGDGDGAVESARRALELLEDRDETTRGYLLSSLGMALLARGDVDGARACQLEVLEAAERIEDAVLAVESRNNLGLVEQRADPAAARRWFEDARDRATRSELAFERARALLGLAELDHAAGDGEAARATLGGLPEGSPERERAERLRALLPA